ncbi:hypothetical protein C8R46DRAFT_1220196 [Mycena filopes]|nr:hypothetical protein C8R46DRAFT_1220196 [Mycena filopes]
MKGLTSQVLSLASMILIPFIPNDILRDIMLVLAPLFLTAHLVHQNTPLRWVETLEVSAADMNSLWGMAEDECSRDPLFVYKTGLKLTEIGLALSTLRTRTFDMKRTPWTECPYQIITITRAINECRRDMDDLRSSILLALEISRQETFREDISRRRATLASAFPAVLFGQQDSFA